MRQRYWALRAYEHVDECDVTLSRCAAEEQKDSSDRVIVEEIKTERLSVRKNSRSTLQNEANQMFRD